MFIAILLIAVRNWKLPRCSLIEEWIKDMWYIYKMEYCSAIKNNEMKVADEWIELDRFILSEVTQTQKDKHDIYSLISRH